MRTVQISGSVIQKTKPGENQPFIQRYISPIKMAEGNLSKDREKFALFKTILNARRHRKWTQQSILIINTVIARRRLLLQVFSFILRWFPLTRASSKLLYYDRAGISKGTLLGETQFGTPIVKNDLNLYRIRLNQSLCRFLENSCRTMQVNISFIQLGKRPSSFCYRRIPLLSSFRANRENLCVTTPFCLFLICAHA